MDKVVVVGVDPAERWQAPPALVLGLAGVVVAVVLTLIAVFPRSGGARPAGQSAAAPDLAQWRARYEESNRAPVGVDAPLELPGGHRLTSMSVWRPGLYVAGTIWHRVLIGQDGSWIFVGADPTTGLDGGSDEAVAIPSLGALRSAAGEDVAVLEWDASGYAMRIEGSGLSVAELKRVAAGIRLPEDRPAVTDDAPHLGYLPRGFSLIGRPGGLASTVGPGEAGWRASYLLEGGAGVTLTAAEDPAYPFAELFSLAPDHHAQIRGYWGLAFDGPDGTESSDTAVRSRLLWFEEGALLEATSTGLSAAELLATIGPLDLRHPEARVMRTSIARSRLGFGRRASWDVGPGGLSAAELLDIIAPPDRRP